VLATTALLLASQTPDKPCRQKMRALSKQARNTCVGDRLLPSCRREEMARVGALALGADFLQAEAETLHQAGDYEGAINRLLRSPRRGKSPCRPLVPTCVLLRFDSKAHVELLVNQLNIVTRMASTRFRKPLWRCICRDSCCMSYLQGRRRGGAVHRGHAT